MRARCAAGGGRRKIIAVDRARDVRAFGLARARGRSTTTRWRARARTMDAAASSADETARDGGLTLVVGGAGRVGRLVCERLRATGRAVRVVTRDAESETARALRDAGCEVVGGDVGDEASMRAALSGCEGGCVIATFGAQRIGRVTDVVTNPSLRDAKHPRFVNYLGAATLARLSSEAGARKFVRVTGASVGYPAFDFIAVLLNVVLSMTIRWQLAGEMAVRAACEKSSMKYVVVRPGNLADFERCDEDESGNRRVVLGSGGSRVEAGKISRSDVADVIVEALERQECENVTLTVAGLTNPSGGVRTELSWDPAKGMHWRTVETDATVREGRSYREDSMWTAVTPDSDALKEKAHRRYVAMFLALLAGIFVLLARGVFLLVRSFM
ncbi:hypothetical protein BE221DRAFT_194072 [Ostreococcus tauri]|uniref:NAD(P)-binding domain-containing protein n=1 Tax=Ostreococcus tauri TaxID=70448 RepID=A0A1Y5I3B7_OSTTA|nr:hypothetical protein BE221DRAFT_194072 [Ostreococcus tauri]